jgi:glycine/D-amino acid oxidase-like deaminating enzyme
MDLHSGQPIWLIYDQRAFSFDSLSIDLNCDVAIIGGGVTGALLADRLTREGREVVLLDQRTPGVGSTLASTGLLQYALDQPLHRLIDTVGKDRAVHAYRRSLAAIDELEALVAAYPDKCRLRRRPSYYLASRLWHLRALRREYRCLKAHGLPVDFVTRRQLRAMGVRSAYGAIRSASDGDVDPLCLTQRALMSAVGRGLRAFSGTRVEKITESENHIALVTDVGATVRCDHVVIATGYEAQQFLALDSVNLQSTYVAVSKPMPDHAEWPEEALFWETARPYFYARRLQDGRAIIGGADTAFHDDHERQRLIDRKVQRLLRRFHRLFPQLEFVLDGQWAGTFAETATSLPLIGRVKSHPRRYMALGYGGNGITFSMIAARLIADLIAGRSNPDECVFAPPDN